MPGVQREQELIHEETRAVEAYKKLLSRILGAGDHATAEALKKLCDDHRHSQQSLLQLSENQDPYPSHLSGGWDVIVEAIQEGDRLSGMKSILASLRQGEEHSLKMYEKALKDESLSQELYEVIKNSLIRQQHQHLASLDNLIYNLEGIESGVSLTSEASGPMTDQSGTDRSSPKTLH